ncbi:MAG: serine hydrolase domain-containing protein [Chitinophagales bacterium]
MKKFSLVIFFFCGFCLLTWCKQSNINSKSIALSNIKISKTEEYYTKNLFPKINIADTNIVAKVAQLDTYFNNNVKTNGFNGSVLIAYKGTIIYKNKFGYQDYHKKIPLTDSSSFQIASTSKTFTSAAILLLHQYKYLDIDESIDRFFPNLPYKGITIRMLLSHRSGLPDYLDFTETLWKSKSFMSNQDVIDLMVKYKPARLAVPNTCFKYNNSNFVLLASIIEQISGLSYADFMDTYFFKPLGMKNTFVYDPLNVPAKTVLGYKGSNYTEDKIVATDGVVGDKGIYSTVDDLYKWNLALYSGKLVDSKILGMAYTPQSFEKPGNQNYGLGWRMNEQDNGTRLIYHNGWWHSFNSVFNRKLNDGTCIIVLSNHFCTCVYKIQGVWDILYGEGNIAYK